MKCSSSRCYILSGYGAIVNSYANKWLYGTLSSELGVWHNFFAPKPYW